MTTRREWRGVRWVDAENPTTQEIRALVDEFNLSPIVGEEIARSTWRSVAERTGNALLLTLHFPPTETHGESKSADEEIDFVIEERLLITVRQDHNAALYRFGKEMEAEALGGARHTASKIPADGADLFVLVLRKLYEVYFAACEQNTKRLARIEEGIFKGMEKEMVAPLSKAGRELLDAKRALSFHRTLLESFGRIAPALFKAPIEPRLRAVLNDVGRLHFIIERNLDLLVEMRETNTALLSTKQNEIMKVLTIMAFVTFPLSLIASIFGMNTKELPIVGLPHDFWIVIGIMGTLTFIFFLFFKKNKWL